MLSSRSNHGYAGTVRRLVWAMERRGLTVFARIDHAAAAREVGLDLAAEEVIIFGNPRAGTGLMQADPRIGIELPLRVLVWQGEEGVQVGYKDPRELAHDYAVQANAETLGAMFSLLAELVREASE